MSIGGKLSQNEIAMRTGVRGMKMTPFAYRSTTEHLKKFNTPEKMGLLLYVSSTEDDYSVLITHVLDATDRSLRLFIWKMTKEGAFVSVPLGGGNRKHLILSRGLKEEYQKFYSLFV